MIDREKILNGLNCCSDPEGSCRKCPYGHDSKTHELCMDVMAADTLALLNEQQEIIDELNTAIKEWRNLKWFTPYEVGIAMVTHGQKDPQFKWGETIRYSPSEVEKILNEVNRDE